MRWGLELKDDSCLVAHFTQRGFSNHLSPEDPSYNGRWKQVSIFPVLGHHLSTNGSISNELDLMFTAMFRAFWANTGAPAAKRLSAKAKWKLNSSAVAPHLTWRCSRWPLSENSVARIDRFQRRLCAYTLPFSAAERAEASDPIAFKRARGRRAGVICRADGLWSKLWATRVIAWNNHLTRGHLHWCNVMNKFACWRGPAWLTQQRV